jgi:hypothetical protein
MCWHVCVCLCACVCVRACARTCVCVCVCVCKCVTCPHRPPRPLQIERWQTKVEEECGEIVSVLVQNKIDLLDQAAVTRYHFVLWRVCVEGCSEGGGGG